MFLFNVTSERHKVINDLCSIFLIGDIFGLFFSIFAPALFLATVDLICKKFGYYDLWNQFASFVIVFWNLLLAYWGIKARFFFIPSWLFFSMIFLIGNFGVDDGKKIKWTLVSAVYTLVCFTILWILSIRKKKSIEKATVEKSEFAASQLSEIEEDNSRES